MATGKTAFEDSRNVLIEEQVVIFLWTVNFDASTIAVAEGFITLGGQFTGKVYYFSLMLLDFNVSNLIFLLVTSTKSLKPYLLLYYNVIKLPTTDTYLSICIVNDDKYSKTPI